MGPVLSIHYETGLCRHYLQLACGCGSMSEAVFLTIIACILEDNNKTRKWNRK
jgi:hypothetical protein